MSDWNVIGIKYRSDGANKLIEEAKNVRNEYGKLGTQIRTTNLSTNEITESWKAQGSALDSVGGKYFKLGLGIVAAQMAMDLIKRVFTDFIDTVKNSVESFRSFEKSMAAVSTTLESKDIKYMSIFNAEVNKLSIEFGQSADDISKGLYEILSAATPVADALNLLYISTKASVAGLTDVKTAVAVNIDIMNAWGYTVNQMVKANDILFESVLRGKFTFGQLESAIGYVAPIAAEAGISLEEVGAVLSSSTRRGMHLDSVTRGMALAIQNIIDPTKEASDTAARYGIELSSAALQSKGFANFLKELNEKLAGNDEALLKIFGNMRSYRVMMALTGEGMGAFTEDLDAMNKSSGKMTEAFEKMATTAQMASDILTQATESISRNIGKNTNDVMLFIQGLEKLKTQLYATFTDIASKPPGKIGFGEAMVAGMSEGAYTPGTAEAYSSVKSYTDLIDKYIENTKRRTIKSLKSTYGGEKSLVTPTEELGGAKQYIKDTGIINDLSEEWLKLQERQINTGEDLSMELQTINIKIADQQGAVDENRDSWMSYNAKIDDANSSVEKYSNLIETNTTTMDELKIEIGEIGNAYDGLIGIQLKLAEETENLRKKEDKYKTAIESNNLAIMRIELSGMMRRRGLTRGEERQIKQLQIENLKSRIDMADATVNEQQRVKTAQEEAYASELQSFRDLVSGKETLYSTLKEQIASDYSSMITAQQTALGLMQGLYGVESTEVFNLTVAYNKLNRARKGEIVDVGGVASSVQYNILPGNQGSLGQMLHRLSRMRRGSGLQRGGHIYDTGLYLLHEGENVSPKGKSSSGGGLVVNISPGSIVINGAGKVDVNESTVAKLIGKAIAKDLMFYDSTGKLNTRFGLR